MNTDPEMETFFQWVSETIALAVQVKLSKSADKVFLQDIETETERIVTALYERVRGNRPVGSEMRAGDITAMVSATIREGYRTVQEAEGV